MRSILHSIVLATAGIAASCGTTAAMAETLNVPFNFTVAGKTCAAGEYSVKRAADGFVRLQSKDSANSFAFVLRPGNPNPNDSRVILSFADAGRGVHSLSSVQYGPQVAMHLNKDRQVNERVPMTMIQGQ